MTRNSLLYLLGAAAAAVLPGCSEKYEQKDLGPDSPQGRQVRRMVDALRAGGTGNLDAAMAAQAVSGLDAAQSDAMRATLTELIQADAVQLVDLYLHGEKVYRASFRLTAGDQTRDLFMLLVETGGEIRWAGRN